MDAKDPEPSRALAATEPGTSGPADFLVVGVGASAGGLQALQEMLSACPESCALAFVVVTHQQAGRQSMLGELLAPHTPLTVQEAVEGVRVQANHVYLSPPGAYLTIVDGVLALESHPEGLRMPIDHFFHSLARDQGSRAVAVVLSGTGTDGTVGLREVKAQLGLVVAQDESSARYPGMPRSAITADVVDVILPADKIIRHLVSLQRRPLPSEHEGTGDDLPEAFHQIFGLLRARNRHDFSSYKRSTIRRRIERRMTVHQLDKPAQYVRHLQSHPGELDALFRELLIGVTSFFRDPEAFAALEKSLLELLQQRGEDHVFRVWVAGCSTGEEAYSIAILLRECMDRLKRHLPVQIFATDLDADAIHFARSGLYPESVVGDLSRERLERFFNKEDDSYRIRKDVREDLIFAPQNMIADPPFTKLDLLSCRNLLIYLDGRLQQRLLPIFHYALRAQGVLFLGSSESVGNSAHLFRVVDKKAKLFVRREVASGSYATDFPAAAASPEVPLAEPLPLPPLRKRSETSLSQLSEKMLLAQLVPPSAIVHERGDIVHIHGRTGQFLEPAPGSPSAANIFTMAREGLQLELTSAIRQAGSTSAEVLRRGVRIRGETGQVSFDLRVKRLLEPEPFRGLFLVTFDHPQATNAEPEVEPDPAAGTRPDRAGELERELLFTKESHQSTVEELETANEELKSTNEELQSTNEELQSANEELETSKEEMQSLNEELSTVNAELQGKVEELSRVNDDMKNLLNGTDIATIFLDNQLNIKRFTDRARKVVKVIASDIGRPLSDLVSKLRYPGLLEDAHEVVRTLAFKEAEVEALDGCWYLVRMVPYRTTENVIDGLVLTFVEITKVKDLQENQRYMLRALEASSTSVAAQDLTLRYIWAFSPVFGVEPGEVVGKTDVDLVGPTEGSIIASLKERVVQTGRPARQRIEVTIRGQKVAQELLISPLRDVSQQLIGITCLTSELGKG